MSVVIPDEIVQATHWTPDELIREVAVHLFERERLTLAQAARLAGMSRLQFQQVLADREIPIHYGVAEFDAGLQTLRELGQL